VRVARSATPKARLSAAGTPRGWPFVRLLVVPFAVATMTVRCGGKTAAQTALPEAPANTCPAGMAAIPGGSYTLGDRHDTVTVAPFCLDITEVTVDAYAACVGSGRCTADHPGQWTPDGTTFTADARCNYGVGGRGSHPMNCVDWGQSGTYCGAQGKRLPTEEEWEWAARGGSQGRVYPWGNAAPDFQLCWSGLTRRAGTCSVGSFPAGDAPGGVHDLAGNVWEWTSSNFDVTGAARVIRGGGWGDVDASGVRSSYRDGNAPSYRYHGLGFRCAR
jgi:formylglycine-generating enzyme required for sulfatase activity